MRRLEAAFFKRSELESGTKDLDPATSAPIHMIRKCLTGRVTLRYRFSYTLSGINASEGLVKSAKSRFEAFLYADFVFFFPPEGLSAACSLRKPGDVMTFAFDRCG